MKILKDPDFEKVMHHPEHYNWENLDSYMLNELSDLIVYRIMNDLETKDRNLVPGLRAGLKFLKISRANALLPCVPNL